LLFRRSGRRACSLIGRLIFRAAPPCTGFSYTVTWPVGQVGIEFLPTATNRIDVQADDERDERITPVADLLRFQSGEPTPLLLIEAAEEEIHLAVQFSVGVGFAGSAIGALALVNVDIGHDKPAGCHFCDARIREGSDGN
jgi:hypothetical protein